MRAIIGTHCDPCPISAKPREHVYGEADEASFVKLAKSIHTAYATTVADVENHQIIDILPTRNYTDVAGWVDKQPRAWKEQIRFGALDMSAT